MSAAQASESLRVLVIDDDDVSRETMVELLREGGHDVSGLPSPIGATKHIVSAEIQVVVLDVMMPSMRGDKLAALLFKNPRLKSLGVVLVTGAAATELATLASEVKAAAIVSKSSLDQELLPAVRRAARRG